MGDVVKEMSNHVPKGFFRHYIFLATYMAIASLYNTATIQAILLLSLRNMGQSKNFLKNKYKKYKPTFFFVNEQFKVTLNG